jgi:predicted O-methyltransferase YrrM
MVDIIDILSNCKWMMKEPDATILLNTATSINPHTIVEVGGGPYGASTAILASVASKSGGLLYSVEPQERLHWEETLNRLDLREYVKRYVGYSPWTNVELDSIDYLFIDGNHRTRWVLADYHWWSPMVRNGGMVAFHDFNDSNAGKEVRRAIDIILETDKLVEVDKWNGIVSCGIIVFSKTGVTIDEKP